MKRNKILDLPLQKNNNNDEIKNNSINSTQSKIISLEEFKKLKMLKNRDSINSKPSLELERKKPVIDFFALADDIIRKYPEKNIKRKELINALFNTGGNEKNFIEMATNET